MSTEQEELDKLMSEKCLDETRAERHRRRRRAAVEVHPQDECVQQPSEPESEPANGTFRKWTTANDKSFFPAAKTVRGLPPAAYEVTECPTRGLHFQTVDIKTEDILRLPEKNIETVVSEIEKFWTLRDKFERHGLVYKRGMFLWGPPGSGKTCAIQLLCKDVIARGGIVIRHHYSSLTIAGFRMLREIEPDKPVVVVLEDMEDMIHNDSETALLNLLDGGENIDNVVFLATSNYPERLGARIINRPSRFDKRFKIGMPNEDSRRMFLAHLDIDNDVDLDTWVKDTEGLSMAHLKELFVSVTILGDEYEHAVARLHDMGKAIQSDKEFETKEMGFLA